MKTLKIGDIEYVLHYLTRGEVRALDKVVDDNDKFDKMVMFTLKKNEIDDIPFVHLKQIVDEAIILNGLSNEKSFDDAKKN